MKIGYVLNTYPAPSHSFIRREIQALERGGVEVVRLPMRPSEQALVDPGDLSEADKCVYVLQLGAARLLLTFLAVVARAPRRACGAFWLAIRSGYASRSIIKHIIYLIEAAHVAEYAKTEGVQHIHAHFGTNAAMVARLAAALGGPGYSFTAHGPEEFDSPHALSLGGKVDDSRFSVAISSFGRSQLCRWAAFESWAKVRQVHCGIEPGKFTEPKPVPRRERMTEFVTIGRFVEQKGQMILLEALHKAVKQAPNLHLTLVGDGEMRGALEEAVQRLELQVNVTFAGWLSEAEVRASLDQSHALVMPSFAEGLPMVVMEAMAAARPVLATYVAGTPELVVPGKTGWLVPAGDSDALAQAMVELANTDITELNAFGVEGRGRVLQRHDIDVEAEKLKQHFAEAIGAT